jgi:hypothetical protein
MEAGSLARPVSRFGTASRGGVEGERRGRNERGGAEAQGWLALLSRGQKKKEKRSAVGCTRR